MTIAMNAGTGAWAEHQWPKVAGFIERAFAKSPPGDVTVGMVRAGLASARDLLWILRDDKGGLIGAAVTQMKAEPNGKTCLILAAGGVGVSGHIATVMKTIEQYAQSCGCVAVMLRGRKGWRRVLPGYAFDGRWMRRNLR